MATGPRGIFAVVLIVIVVLGAGSLAYRRFAPGARQLRAGIAEQTRELSGEPEPVSDGAVQQRHGARRAAVVAMKADLLKLVAAESAVAAKTGRPWSNLGTDYRATSGNVGPYITLTRNGWWATMSNTLTGIHCAVAVGGDTTFGGAKSGEPWCFGEKDMTAAQ